MRGDRLGSLRSLSDRSRRGRVAASVLASVVVVGALAGSLAGCANDPLADQYRAGDNKGYVGADGFTTAEIAPADRQDPVSFEGAIETGDTVSSEDYLGEVLVVNFWYAACGPCRAEASQLEDAYSTFAGDGVAFLGVNTSDSAAAASAFAKNYGVTYSSLIAAEDGAIKLAFAERTPINATPTTLVLDRQGRVAARIIGQLPDASILEALVRDTLAEAL